MKNPMKRPLNDIIFFCGFETETTIKTPERTTYTLVDIPSNTKIKLILWQPEDFPDEEYALSVEHNGLENLSKTGVNRWNRVWEKLNKIPNLTVSIEDLREPIFTEEQEKKLDELCKEYGVEDDEQ